MDKRLWRRSLRNMALGATLGGGSVAMGFMIAGMANIGSLGGLVFAAVLWAVYFGTSGEHD